jgi:hypothetical protein
MQPCPLYFKEELKMKVKGKRIINADDAAEFANSVRGQYIISQALVMSSKVLKGLEDRDDIYPVNGDHAEPSNRADMEFLLEAFPLYRIHEESVWEETKDASD